MKLKSETDTPEQKMARSQNGGEKLKDKDALDRVWCEVQALNRAAGPWGIHPPSAAFIDYQHDWRADAAKARA